VKADRQWLDRNEKWEERKKAAFEELNGRVQGEDSTREKDLAKNLKSALSMGEERKTLGGGKKKESALGGISKRVGSSAKTNLPSLKNNLKRKLCNSKGGGGCRSLRRLSTSSR